MTRFRYLSVGLASLGVALLACPASAAIIELEPNNTLATATPIVRGAVPWMDMGLGDLAIIGGDVDFFEISLNLGELMVVGTLPLHVPYLAPDTVLGVFSSGGTLLTVNDDADATTKGSKVSWGAAYSGFHYIAVSGFDDMNFDGLSDSGGTPHVEDGLYALSVTIVPEPGPLVLLGAGVVVGVLRRRRFRSQRAK